MRWQRLVLPLLLSMLFAPLEVNAAGGLLSESPESSPLEAKIAVAVAPSRTTRWLSLRARDAAEVTIWLVPVGPTARVDYASDAWFSALEDATAPRILPPSKAPSCLGLPKEPELHGDPSDRAARLPMEVQWLAGLAEVVDYADSLGVAIPAALSLRIVELVDIGYRFMAATHVATGPGDWLAPLRIVDDSPAVLPLALSRAGMNEPMKVTAFVLGAGRASFGTMASPSIAPSDIVWKRDGSSSYASLRDDLLAAGQGRSWIIESVGHELMFSATGIPNSVNPIPSLLEAYLLRAEAHGEAADAQSCLKTLGAFATHGATVAPACAEGALRSPSEPCIENPRPGELDPELLRCGAADDVALAFSGLRPAAVVVTRAVGIVAALGFGEDAPLSLAEGPELSPLVKTTKYEACESGDAGDPWESPGGGSAPPPWTPPPFPNEGDLVAAEGAAVAAFGCGSSHDPEYDEWDSGESCSSGTGGSGDWEDSGESCDSGDYEGSSDEDYDSCEGGSGGGYGEDEEEECSVAPRRKRSFRPRLSVYTLALAALALPIRRRTRKPRNRQP